MVKGLLWFDNDPKRSILEKVQDAAGRFQEKFGQVPNAAWVNTKYEIDQVPVALHDGTLIVHADRGVLYNHVWVGTQET